MSGQKVLDETQLTYLSHGSFARVVNFRMWVGEGIIVHLFSKANIPTLRGSLDQGDDVLPLSVFAGWRLTLGLLPDRAAFAAHPAPLRVEGAVWNNTIWETTLCQIGLEDRREDCRDLILVTVKEPIQTT